MRFNFFSKRSKNDNITNPCPVDDTLLPVTLQQYRNKDKIQPMSLSTFFAAVNLVSNSIAMMKWLFKDDENNELPKSHYLYHLFDNSIITKYNIIKNVIKDIILYGNGFIYIERDEETGKPKTLHYSPASQTTIWHDELNHKLYYYNFTYLDRIDDGSNFLHFYMNSDDGFIGKGVLKYAYNVLDIASVIQNATSSYYSTAGQQFGIVSPNGPLPVAGNAQKQMDMLKQKWEEAQMKANKGTVFFPSDLKFTPMTNTAKDSALIEAREFNAVEVGRFVCNISPVLLGDLRNNTYGTLEESQAEFISHSLAPIVEMIEEQCNKKLIMPSKHGKQFIDLDEYSILKTKLDVQANYLSSLTSSGIMTTNEARKVLGLPPVDGGDALVIPFTKIEDNTIGGTGDANEDKNNVEQENEQES